MSQPPSTAFLDRFKGRTHIITRRGPLEIFDNQLAAAKKRLRDIRGLSAFDIPELGAAPNDERDSLPVLSSSIQKASTPSLLADKSDISNSGLLPKVKSREQLSKAVMRSDLSHNRRTRIATNASGIKRISRSLLKNAAFPKLKFASPGRYPTQVSELDTIESLKQPPVEQSSLSKRGTLSVELIPIREPLLVSRSNIQTLESTRKMKKSRLRTLYDLV